MAMSHAEIASRARQRADSEHLHTFKVSAHLYLVKSRQLDPGSHHMVTVDGQGTVTCDCPGYTYRRSCTHVEAVGKRLERAPKASGNGHKAEPANVVSIDQAQADRQARRRQAEQDIADIWG